MKKLEHDIITTLYRAGERRLAHAYARQNGLRVRRVAANLDERTLLQFIDMAAESSGYEEPRGGWKVTREIRSELKKFDAALKAALQEFYRKNRELFKERSDWEDLYDVDGPYLTFMTLRGEGVGIFDGDWDHVLDDKPLKALEKFLEKKLQRYADDTGGGSLNNAFENAAYEQGGAEASAALDPEEVAVMRRNVEPMIKKFGGKLKSRGKKGLYWTVVFADEDAAKAFSKAVFDAGVKAPGTFPSQMRMGRGVDLDFN